MREIWKAIKSNVTSSLTHLDKPLDAPIGNWYMALWPAPLWVW